MGCSAQRVISAHTDLYAAEPSPNTDNCQCHWSMVQWRIPARPARDTRRVTVDKTTHIVSVAGIGIE